jgi:hypothetical protein
MVNRSVLAVLGLALALGACGISPRGPVAYTGPGWYLEKPRPLLALGPEIFAGPFTYEQCEAERMKFPDNTARGLICNPERVQPGYYGPYSPASSTPPPRS